MAFGSLSPLAVPVGSGSTHVEDIYRALRSAVGTSASPDTEGLDDLWRRARAVGMASAQLSLDKAAWQGLPIGATDRLDAYERLLGLSSSSATTEQDRRDAVVAAWTRRILGTTRTIELNLQAISPNFSIFPIDHDKTDTVQHGRTMPDVGQEISRGTTQYPNYSTEFVLVVVYAVPATMTAIPDDQATQSEIVLNEELAAWMDYVISQEGISGPCFYADGGPDGTSVADYTATC